MVRVGTCRKISFQVVFSCYATGQARRDLFLAKNFLADVRPELLENVIQDSGFHLRSKVQSRLTEAPLLRRIISVGQTSFQCIAYHLGRVKARASRICLSDEGPRYRVACAAEKASLAHGVVTRGLVRERGDNGFGKKRPRDAVREGAPIIASITGDSVAQLRIGIQGHGLCGKDSSPRKRGVIQHAIVCGEYEFLAGGKRWKLRIGVHRCEIRNEPEHTLALLGSGIVFFVLRSRSRVRQRSGAAVRGWYGIRVAL